MVGDPGIEPGAGRPGGVTVRCRTLQRVAHSAAVINLGPLRRQGENGMCRNGMLAAVCPCGDSTAASWLRAKARCGVPCARV